MAEIMPLEHDGTSVLAPTDVNVVMRPLSVVRQYKPVAARIFGGGTSSVVPASLPAGPHSPRAPSWSRTVSQARAPRPGMTPRHGSLEALAARAPEPREVEDPVLPYPQATARLRAGVGACRRWRGRGAARGAKSHGGLSVVSRTVDPVEQDRVLVRRQERPDPYCGPLPRTVAIVDADALLSSIDNDCRNPGRRSRMLRSTHLDNTILFASDHVFEEVYEKLPKIARSSPVPLADLRRRLEAGYMPKIRFVDVSMPEPLDPRVLEVVDVADRPTANLAMQIAPVIVFSGDRHLRDPGFAPPAWRDAAAATASVAEAAGKQVAVSQAVGLPLAAAWSGSGAIATKVEVSPALFRVGLIVLGGFALYWLLVDPDQRAAAKKAAGKAASRFFEMLDEQVRVQEEGLRAIHQVIFRGSDEEPTAHRQALIMLARAREPLVARELHERMVGNFPDELLPTVKEIRAVLNEGSEFVQVDRSRWQLGRELEPWQGRYKLI